MKCIHGSFDGQTCKRCTKGQVSMTEHKRKELQKSREVRIKSEVKKVIWCATHHSIWNIGSEFCVKCYWDKALVEGECVREIL